jgi:peptidoglycan/xylan/chitin deacetylase (PgdA/CDA1 family)
MLINLSVDDLTYHSDSNMSVIEGANYIIKAMPQALITLFIPAAYWRTVKNNKNPTPLFLSNNELFVNELKALPSQYEFAYHGYFHGIENVSNNDEFKYLSTEEAIHKIELMEEEVKKCGLEDRFKKIFRPPGWGINDDVIQVFLNKGYHLSLASEAPFSNNFAQIQHPMISYYNVSPPMKSLDLFEKTSVVYHACTWSKNYLSIEAAQQFIDFYKDKDIQLVSLDKINGD